MNPCGLAITAFNSDIIFARPIPRQSESVIESPLHDIANAIVQTPSRTAACYIARR